MKKKNLKNLALKKSKVANIKMYSRTKTGGIWSWRCLGTTTSATSQETFDNPCTANTECCYNEGI